MVLAQRWAARLLIDGEYTYLGSFNTEIQAAKVYDKEAVLHPFKTGGRRPLNFNGSKVRNHFLALTIIITLHSVRMGWVNITKPIFLKDADTCSSALEQASSYYHSYITYTSGHAHLRSFSTSGGR